MYLKRRRWLSITYVALALLAALHSFPVNAQNKKSKGGYVIKGKIDGLECPQMALYIMKGKEITGDSTKVKKESFTFKGTLPYPQTVVIKSSDEVVSDIIFLDNTDVTITGSMDDPKHLTVTGSKSHAEYEAYEAMIDPIQDALRPLHAEARKIAKEDKEATKAFVAKNMDPLKDELMQRRIDFVKDHPDSYVGLWVLAQIYKMPPALEVKAMFDAMPAPIRECELGQQVGPLIEKRVATRKGVPAPPFTQEDVAGNPVSLESFKGQYVLIDFWASWCAPCRKENPNLKKAYDEFKDKGLKIIGVSLDHDKDRWVHAIEKDGLPWIQVSDLKGWKNAVAEAYGVNAVPANFLVDPDGEIIATNLRGEALEEKLDEVLH